MLNVKNFQKLLIFDEKIEFLKLLENASGKHMWVFRSFLEEIIKRLGSCSASRSGGNQVDDLPPALHTEAVSASWKCEGSATTTRGPEYISARRVIRKLFQLVGHPDGNGRKHDVWWRFFNYLKSYTFSMKSDFLPEDIYVTDMSS